MLRPMLRSTTRRRRAPLPWKKPVNGIQIGTPEFPVENGKERQWCYYFKLPSDADIDIVKFQIDFWRAAIT